MATIVHIAVEIFLAMLQVFTHLAVLLFSTILGALLAVSAIVLGILMLTGTVSFGVARSRKR